MDTQFENLVLQEGLAIFHQAKNEKASLFDKQFWLGRVMDLVLKDANFKVDMFRFVDVLPMLKTKDQVAKHINEYLLKKDRDVPFLQGMALKAASLSFTSGLAASAIRKNVAEMATRFILEKDISQASVPLKKLSEQGFSFTIDLLGEKTLSYSEANAYLARYTELIEQLPHILASFRHQHIPHDAANVSIKVSALVCNLKSEDPDASVERAKQQLIPMLRAAKQAGVFINFDMESFETNEIISRLFIDIIESAEFKNSANLGIVVQAYLKNAHAFATKLVDAAKNRGHKITIRLVKGAYWDYEVVKAQLRGTKPPVFTAKALSDQNFEAISRLLLDNIDFVRPAFGSHNVRSLAQAIAYADQKNIDKKLYEIQMLYGMAEAERKTFLSRGHHVRIYAPIGDMLPGMSYLVRRLLENTSQMGFVKLKHHDDQTESQLLQAPIYQEPDSKIPKANYFANASFTDFTDEAERNNFSRAILEVKNLLPINVPIKVANKVLTSERIEKRCCPSDLNLEVTHTHFADEKTAQLAVEKCLLVQDALTDLGLSARASHLRKLAHSLQQDRYFLAALMVYEVGKTWAEADADVVEAIDFCNFYADRALAELSSKPITSLSGENNVIRFQGRGPCVVIAPWNFPLAILCGMSVSAYVAGNPVIMKPAEQSSATAYHLYERMLDAGFLSGAIHFLPGQGEQIGAFLVGHKDVANINFTGSMAVGHQIVATAAKVVKGQRQMKRVVCEMGGKNAIIIDDDADLDEAVAGVLKSAFAYAGQKCSAASRILVIDSIKGAFLERLISATSSLVCGNPANPSTFMGPVIDQESFRRLNDALQKISQDQNLTLRYLGEKISGGFFVPPAIIELNDPHHWLMQEELFGPILAIFPSKDLAHALAVANDTTYALTGAIFSRSPENIRLAQEKFAVGNLYINAPCTGAMVSRQPFGGFKMSGLGAKAGGENYLHNFVDAKVVSENTMRCGFTPDVL